MLFDRSLPTVSVSCALAVLLMTVGGGLAFADTMGWLPGGSGSLGIVAVSLAHLLAMTKVLRGMAGRERDAFELGREYGQVTPLR